MSDNKIKVVGYTQKVSYAGGIEYRNFSPDLVGAQLVSDGGTPLFTMGNFSITTNMDPKTDKSYKTNDFSEFTNLDKLNLTLEQTKVLLDNNASVFLNLDKTNLNNYALFGSLTEFVRISLEDIILKWPAALYITPIAQTPDGISLNGNTCEDYVYDYISNIATFRINTTFIDNKFDLNFLLNGDIINTFNATNDLRNVTVNYRSYVLFKDNLEYPVIAFTGSNYTTSDYIYLSIKGDPFSGKTSVNLPYHIKPAKIYQEHFFNDLPDFEAYLLNRRLTPIYTSRFDYPLKSDDGIILYVSKFLTWPISDGYNIDFETTSYVDYVTNLIEICNNNDLYTSNLMNRFLVSESISAFDTTPVHLSELDQDTSGGKINKTLQLYGRMFDDINNFITGVAFANTVSYDKKDNTPDVYLKNLATVMGWGLISSVMENNLLSNYITTADSQFSGESVGLTAVEADIELWRRIILNTPWIWKSKGARKSIEFLLRFIGVPQGLVKFNEYIYKADGPIDLDLFREVLTLNGLDTDTSVYPIDSDGYPNPLPDTEDMYFQNYGLWYRQTGGSGSTIDISTGNNPHVGPYDGGSKYINQFSSLIPDFSAVTITSQTTETGSMNLYTNNELGTFDGTPVNTTINTAHLTSLDGQDLSNCYVFSASVVSDIVHPGQVFNNCGCPCEGVDNVLSLCVSENLVINKHQNVCRDTYQQPIALDNGLYLFSFYRFNKDGSPFKYKGNISPLETFYASRDCCKAIGGTPWLNIVTIQGVERNSGYFCCDKSGKCGCTIACDWIPSIEPILLPKITNSYNGPQSKYLEFIKQDGTKSVVTPDGCNCINSYTIKIPNIVDPYTNQVGYACQLTDKGVEDLQNGKSGYIYKTYNARLNSVIGCDEQLPIADSWE